MEKKKQTEGTVFISEADQYLFAQGTHCLLYTSPSPRDA